MNLSSNKKIAILGIVLLVLAGMIVVALKGMNVDLMLAQHKSINIAIGKEYDIHEVERICKEVLGNKAFVVRKIGTFGDAVNVNVISITDEEKTNLVEKINQKYSIQLVANEISVNSNSNIRIRDMIRPYILPVSIVFIAIYAYIAIKYKNLNSLKVLLTITGIIVITEAVLASLVAIVRIPVTPVVVNLLFVIALAEIIVFMYKKEKDLKTIGLEK